MATITARQRSQIMRANFLRTASAGTLGLTFALALALPVHAQDAALGKYASLGEQFYNDPYKPPQGLRFSVLEAAIGTDPLTWSSDPGSQLHRTPETQLAE